MRTAPTNWNTIVSGDYKYEIKLNIGGIDFFQGAIYSLSTQDSAMPSDAPNIGGALSGEIDAVLKIIPLDEPEQDVNGGTFIWTDGDNVNGGTYAWNDGDNINGGNFVQVYIPKMASVDIFVRVVDTTDTANVSDWLHKGHYYIDTRATDKKSGKFTLHGYDSMLKAEQTYMPSVSSGPMTTAAIVSEIATLIGVTVEATTLAYITNHPYSVPYYAGQYTAREMLGYIGASYCGSFVISEANELKLIKITDSGTIINVGAKARSHDVAMPLTAYDKVEIVLDSTNAVVAGTGDNVFEFDCPFGTQAMANTILGLLSSYHYRPYTAEKAVITPLAELGDSATIQGTTGQIFNRATTFDVLMACDISADFDEEMNHEYTYTSQAERKIKRYYDSVQSQFLIMASEISSKVSQETYNTDITAADTGLKDRMTIAESEIEQNATDITSKVSINDYNGNEIASRINQSATTIDIDADKINFNGKTIKMSSSELIVEASSGSASAIKLSYGNYYTAHTATEFYISDSTNKLARLALSARSSDDVIYPYFSMYDVAGTRRIYMWTEQTAGWAALQMRDANNTIRIDEYCNGTTASLNFRDTSNNKRIEIKTTDTDGALLAYNPTTGNVATRIGYNSSTGTSGMQIYSGTNLISALSEQGLALYNANGNIVRMYISSAGLELKDSSGVKIAVLNSNGLSIYNTSGTEVLQLSRSGYAWNTGGWG